MQFSLLVFLYIFLKSNWENLVDKLNYVVLINFVITYTKLVMLLITISQISLQTNLSISTFSLHCQYKIG